MRLKNEYTGETESFSELSPPARRTERWMNRAPGASSPSSFCVLVVGSEPSCLMILEECITQAGKTPLVVKDGFEALAKFDPWSVRMVIADVDTPGIDGLDLALRLKSLSPGTPVVLMTSTESEEFLARRSRANRLLRKPLVHESLVTLLHEVDRSQ